MVDPCAGLRIVLAMRSIKPLDQGSKVTVIIRILDWDAVRITIPQRTEMISRRLLCIPDASVAKADLLSHYSPTGSGEAFGTSPLGSFIIMLK